MTSVKKDPKNSESESESETDESESESEKEEKTVERFDNDDGK